MTEHLPECCVGENDCNANPCQRCHACCICEQLRACEQRMLDDGLPAAANHGQRGYEIGYAAALDAAREAVKHLQHSDDCYYEEGVLCHCEIKRAITAIDALREKQ